MNKFMDLEEARQAVFRDIFEELERLYLASQGKLLNLYYKFRRINFVFTRQWEYPWAILNSNIREGDLVLDTGCGNSPLLFYLYKRRCLCYGLDKHFSSVFSPLSSYTIKKKIAERLSRIYPLYFLVNPHGLDGLSSSARALRFNIKYINGNLNALPFNDNTFDRIFCISVIEHLLREDMLKAAGELSRILKPQGLLIVTIDVWGTGLLWQDFIRGSGLSLFGESDLTLPPKGKYAYNVVGFVLRKQYDKR